jgi:hypothetical protein
MLCYVDGEVISYSACALTGQNVYTAGTYIRRGQLGTTIASHAVGSLFVRLDASIYKYTYDPVWQGKTVYFKFQAVNSFGNNPQPLSNLSAVAFPIGDTNSGAIDAETGLIAPIAVITNSVAIGTTTMPLHSPLVVVGLPVYANNAAAVAGGLVAGDFYRTGIDPDPACVVH